MNNKEIKLGIILQYVQMGLSILIGLIYTPIMLRILGDSEYGIYSLASSIISYLSLLSLGLGSSYIRFYSIKKTNGDEEGVKQLNGLYLIVFCFIGIIALITGLALAFNVKVFFNETYSNGDLNLAKTLMIFLAVNMAISFPASIFVSYITSQEKFIIQKLLNMGKTVLSPILCIAFLYLGYGSIGMVIVTTATSIVIDIINVIYSVGKLKMRFNFKHFDFKLLKEIFVFSIFIAINIVIDQINWQTDKIILGKMVNTTAVAVYTVGATINMMYINFSTAISSVFSPRVNIIVSKNEENMDDQLTDLLIKVGRIQFLVISLILTGFIFFGKYFIIKWAGETYVDAYYVILLLICPVTIPLIQNVGIEIQRAKNKHQFRSIIYLFMALTNIGLSIWFCKLWGVIGVAIGTTISLVLANGLIMNIYYQKCLNINIKKFWLEIVKIIPSFILPVALGVVIMLFVNFTSIWKYLLFILLYTVVYLISIYLLGLNKMEKSQIKGLFKKTND